jgi:hypothetical protein
MSDEHERRQTAALERIVQILETVYAKKPTNPPPPPPEPECSRSHAPWTAGHPWDQP